MLLELVLWEKKCKSMWCTGENAAEICYIALHKSIGICRKLTLRVLDWGAELVQDRYSWSSVHALEFWCRGGGWAHGSLGNGSILPAQSSVSLRASTQKHCLNLRAVPDYMLLYFYTSSVFLYGCKTNPKNPERSASCLKIRSWSLLKLTPAVQYWIALKGLWFDRKLTVGKNWVQTTLHCVSSTK